MVAMVKCGYIINSKTSRLFTPYSNSLKYISIITAFMFLHLVLSFIVNPKLMFAVTCAHVNISSTISRKLAWKMDKDVYLQ